MEHIGNQIRFYIGESSIKKVILSRKSVIIAGLLIVTHMISLDGSAAGSLYPDNPKILTVRHGKASEKSLTDIVQSVEYVQLKLPKDQLIAEIYKAIFNDSLIVLLDITPGGSSFKIFCFNQYGNFKFVIDKTGEGPGEYLYIYDFDVTDDFIVISTSQKLIYYDLRSGEYVKTKIIPNQFGIQMIGMLTPEILLSDEGRYVDNESKRQVKIIDLKKGKSVYEALPFDNHAMKIDKTYRYIYKYKNAYTIVPMYHPAIYRVRINEGNYSVKPAFQFDFGKYWVDDDLLANSYNDREIFFKSKNESIHTIEVFETAHLLYVNYKFQSHPYVYIYDKDSGESANIDEFTDNHIGWKGVPVGTQENSIVNTISPYQIEDSDIVPNDKLKAILKNSNDIGHPILVKVKFRIN